MLQDFKGVFVVHQRVDAVPRSVFDLELAAYAVGQFRLGHDFFTQIGKAIQNVPVGSGKDRPAFGVCRIQQRSIGQNDTGGNNGFVRVVGSAAAHAAGVVGENAADKAAVDGGRIRPYFFAEFGQNPVGSGADDARLQGDALRIFAYAPVTPALAYAHKDGI